MLYIEGQELKLQSGSVSGTRYYTHGKAAVAIRRQSGGAVAGLCAMFMTMFRFANGKDY